MSTIRLVPLIFLKVEFDLQRSSYDELVIKEKMRIEQYAVPLGIVWYQPEGSKESFLLTCNNQVGFLIFSKSFLH